MSLCGKFTLLVRIILGYLCRLVAAVWPRDKKIIAIGAWSGERYCDSPMYLSKYLLENTEYRVVWIGLEKVRSALPDHPRMRFAKKDSFPAVLSLLRAGTWVCCIGMDWDLTQWPLEGCATLINTWHGYGIKRCTNGAVNNRRPSLLGALALKLSQRRKPWALVGGEQDVVSLIEGSPRKFQRERMLRIGTPTNDYLIRFRSDKSYIQELKNKYASLLRFNAARKIVLYLPTWRNSGTSVFSFFSMERSAQDRWAAMLRDNNAILLEKHHPRYLESYGDVRPGLCSIPISAAMQSQTDVHELLLIADVLISDYSGACQDYGVLKRPCFHYMYDLDDYSVNCSGLIDGWQDMICGPVVLTEPDLLYQVKEVLVCPTFMPKSGFAETCKYQTGNACAEVCRFIERGHSSR